MKFSTGLRDLDTLLGGGMPYNATVLIKGGPGSGKSTLAVQIMVEAAKLPTPTISFYIGVDEDPAVSLHRLARSYHKLKITSCYNSGYIRTVDLRQKMMANVGIPIRDHALEIIKQFETLANEPANYLIVIDSLSALVDRVVWASTATGNPEPLTERQALVSVIDALAEVQNTLRGRKVTIILIAEQDALRQAEFKAESFLADVVIELSSDTVEVSGTASARALREPLLFCSVNKGRGLPTQWRRCCYDFSSGSGLHFYPTYAAEGNVWLFWENEPQREVIQHFRDVDVPSQYGLVEVNEFTRSGLQREFSIRRRRSHIPPRTPMTLSNMDEYWINAFNPLSSSSGGVGQGTELLEPILPRNIRIYSQEYGDAQRCFGLLPELVAKSLFFRRGGRQHVIAIPQMVNVSFLACRREALRPALLREVIATACENGQFSDATRTRLENMADDHLAVWTPQSWEEMAAVCKGLKSHADAKDDSALPYQFLIETRTWDSLMVTVFEIIWSFGAIFTVRRDEGGELTLRFVLGGFDQVVRALYTLNSWIFRDGIIPVRSTVEPDGNYPRWLFARHWYSTLVGIATGEGSTAPASQQFGRADALGISEIPISEEYLAWQQVPGHDAAAVLAAAGVMSAPRDAVELVSGPSSPIHHSAWGEWYLAVGGGTENMELAIDLINNLMTPRKVNERALSGAGLPPVETFYEHFCHTLCPYTNRTFGWVRETLYPTALSRTVMDLAALLR